MTPWTLRHWRRGVWNMFDPNIPTAALVLNILCGVFLAAAFIMLGYYFHKYRLLQRAATGVKDRLEKESANSILAERIGMEDEGRIRRWLKKPRQLFLYSGLARIIPWLTFEVFLSAGIASACAAYIIGWFLFGDVFYALSFMAAWGAVLIGSQFILSHNNYKVVDKHLISFLNQLANFSAVGAVEVTEVFAQVARYMPYPLRDVLEECYAEARTSGNSAEALAACAGKLEHPKFKEIIRNLESCMRYTADYKVVVDGLRHNILDARRSSQERKSMAASAVTHMLIVTVMAGIVMFISANALGMPILDVMFESVAGRVSLVMAAASYIIFAWNVSRADR